MAPPDYVTPTAADVTAREGLYAIYSAIYPPHARERVLELRRQRLGADFDTCRFEVHLPVEVVGRLVQHRRRLSLADLAELMALSDRREDRIDMDCLRVLGSTDYSYIFKAPISLAAIWMVARARGLLLDELELEAARAALDPYDPYLASDEEDAWSEGDTPAEMALSETSTAEQEEAPAEAQPAAPAGTRHARRLATRARRPQPVTEPSAAAAGSTLQAAAEGSRGREVGVAQGDTASPGELAATEGGGGGGCGWGGDRVEPYSNSIHTSSSLFPSSHHTSQRIVTRPPGSPPAAMDPTAWTSPPTSPLRCPHELGNLD